MAGNEHDWLAHVRDVLAADAGVSSKMAPDDSGGTVAIYASQLSAVNQPLFPCITLHQKLETDKVMPNGWRGVLVVSIFCPDAQQPSVAGAVPVGKNGCGIVYARVKALLHNAHLRAGSPLSAPGWALRFLQKKSRDDTGFIKDRAVYGLVAQFNLVLTECGADTVYGPRP